MIQKTDLRQAYLNKRNSISLGRRREAAEKISRQFKDKGKILSFCSWGSEIDLSPLNQFLAAKSRLCLPKVEKNTLVLFQVENLENLRLSPLGILEPDPSYCKIAQLTSIDLILVPGLAFDRNRFRLGYGKGHYDRFLSQTKLLSIGIGFQEQLFEQSLPRDPWDLPVQELFLV